MLRYRLAVFAISSLGAALAQSPVQLIGARAIMGVGGAMMMPADPRHHRKRVRRKGEAESDRDMGDDGRDRRRAWTDPWRGRCSSTFYWGSVFLVNVPIAGIAIAASLFLVPDSRDRESRPLDIPGALLSMGAVLCSDARHHRRSLVGGRVSAARDYSSHGGRLGLGFRPAREASRIPLAGLFAVPATAVFDRSSRCKSGVLLDGRLHFRLHAIPPVRSGTHPAGRGNSVPAGGGRRHVRRNSQ